MVSAVVSGIMMFLTAVSTSCMVPTTLKAIRKVHNIPSSSANQSNAMAKYASFATVAVGAVLALSFLFSLLVLLTHNKKVVESETFQIEAPETNTWLKDWTSELQQRIATEGRRNGSNSALYDSKLRRKTIF